NRSASANYRQDREVWYVRVALRVIQTRGGTALQNATQALNSAAATKQGAEQSAALYGLADAAWRRTDDEAANAAISKARAQAQGQFDGAADLARQAWQAWPQHQGIALSYVQLMTQQGDDQQAVTFLRERIKQWPDVPRFQQLLAQSLERLGQPIESRKVMA